MHDLYKWSNWGSCVDILAPGALILSASSAADDAYSQESAPSLACPHVSGAAALLLEKNSS
eukprot:7109985-Pyramimonas_sp.AAC.1